MPGGLQADVGLMATLVDGDIEIVFAALAGAFEAAADGGCLLVTTVSDASPVPQEGAR